MDVPIIILGLVMIVVGVLITIVQSKAIKAGKHETGDFIVRLLISGIGLIIGGLIILVKNI